MRTTTKIWLILMILSNIALFFLFKPMILAVAYVDGVLSLNMTLEAWFGLVCFIIANISGTFIFVRFVKSQPFSRQIFFSTVMPSITFILLLFFFFNITSFEQKGIVAAVRSGLQIDSSSRRYIWMAVVAVVYALYLFVTYWLLTKPLRKLQKVLKNFDNNKIKGQISIGGGKEFKSIEEELNEIRRELKEKENNYLQSERKRNGI